MHDRIAPRAATVFHIVVAALLIAAGIVLASVSHVILFNEPQFSRSALTPTGRERSPDHCPGFPSEYNRYCPLPWGVQLPVICSFAIFSIAIAALVLLLVRQRCACANDPVVRTLHGILLVTSLPALLFVASVSFLEYGRQPARAAAWRQEVLNDPANICDLEAYWQCRGFRDPSCTLEKYADCTGRNITTRRRNRFSPFRGTRGLTPQGCFHGWIWSQTEFLVNGVTSVLAGVLVAVDLFVLAYFSVKYILSDAPSEMEEKEEEEKAIPVHTPAT